MRPVVKNNTLNFGPNLVVDSRGLSPANQNTLIYGTDSANTAIPKIKKEHQFKPFHFYKMDKNEKSCFQESVSKSPYKSINKSRKGSRQ